ncbi:hypothetical protein NA56DRAFT_683910 [Hyaloscypha hepaticicola]|uniref:Uncharacterized protein n=1 Tax=Hyaloscypha hepaticicola TaxID=2082293 RepID=A0A2J6QQL7_9HELO|nr:hypothetical protein NA56DRAFT_683910 [Hyaloscypha hepaticicola]
MTYPDLKIEATRTDALMDSRSPETDALLRIATTLIIMDKLLSLLPIASKARTAPLAPPAAPAPTPIRAEDIAIQQALDKVLEYYRTHRPKNTAKNYEPKQREWKLSFKEGGKYLLKDYVDEGKLLLFIKDEVASRASRRGYCLNAEKERKSKGKGKRRAESPL